MCCVPRQIVVKASPMTCYNLLAEPETLQQCIEFMTDYTDLTEKAEEEQAGLDGVTAGITLMYRASGCVNVRVGKHPADSMVGVGDITSVNLRQFQGSYTCSPSRPGNVGASPTPTIRLTTAGLWQGEKLAFDTVEGMPVAGAVFLTEEGSSTKVGGR
eukprot:1179381-Prorocentrum_minimum.AAC.6